MLRIIQVIHTFIVEANDLRSAQVMIADTITIEPVQGVTVVQRQLKTGDPFELDQDLLAKVAKSA